MSKSNQKRNKFNALVVGKLVEKYGFTAYYIRQCLKGERNSLTSDTIRKEYDKLVEEVNNALNK